MPNVPNITASQVAPIGPGGDVARTTFVARVSLRKVRERAKLIQVSEVGRYDPSAAHHIRGSAMIRRALIVVFAVLGAAQTGCMSRCGERHGWFSSHMRSEAPCQTVGRNSAGCFDTVSGPSVAPTTVIPGGTYPPIVPGGQPIDVGPMPSLNENDRISPPAVPVPAPPPNNTLLPFPGGSGIPVKGLPNK